MTPMSEFIRFGTCTRCNMPIRMPVVSITKDDPPYITVTTDENDLHPCDCDN